MIKIPKVLEELIGPTVKKSIENYSLTSEERIKRIKKKYNLKHGGTRQNKKRRKRK